MPTPVLLDEFQKQTLAGLRVVVADDHPGLRKVMGEFMENMGVQVQNIRLVADGKAVLDTVAAEKIDLVLTDVSMPPGMSGLEMVRALRQTPSIAHTPVIMLSLDDRNRQPGLALGVNAFLDKPCNYNDLVRAVLKVMLPAASGAPSAQAAVPAEPTPFK